MNADIEALLEAVMGRFDTLTRVELADGVPAVLVPVMEALLAAYIKDNHREIRNNLRRFVRVAGAEILTSSPGQEMELRAAGVVNSTIDKVFQAMRSQIPDWSRLPAHDPGEWGEVRVRTYYSDTNTVFEQAPRGMTDVPSIAEQRALKPN